MMYEIAIGLMLLGFVLATIIVRFPVQTDKFVMRVWRHVRHLRGDVRYFVSGNVEDGYAGRVVVTYPNGEILEQEVTRSATLRRWVKRADYLVEPVRGYRPPSVVYPYRQVFTFREGDSDCWSGYVRVSFANDDHVTSDGFSADSMDEWQAQAEIEFSRIIEERFLLVERRV